MECKQTNIPLWNPTAFKTEFNVFLKRDYTREPYYGKDYTEQPKGPTQSCIWFEDRRKVQNFFCFWVMIIYKCKHNYLFGTFSLFF